MHRRWLAVTVGMICMFAFAVDALAAHPKKRGVYRGVINSSPFKMSVRIGVSATGKKLTFTYLCGTGRAPTTAYRVPINPGGQFAHTTMTGSQLVWKMSGHFISPTRASVSLNSIVCGGSKGSTALTLTSG
jgi:hypothetical protein